MANKIENLNTKKLNNPLRKANIIVFLSLSIAILSCIGVSDKEDHNAPIEVTEPVDDGNQTTCIFSRAESYFPLKEGLYWDFIDKNGTIHHYYVGQKVESEGISYFPILIDCSFPGCRNLYSNYFLKPDGVFSYDATEKSETLIYKRIVNEGDMYSIYQSDFTEVTVEVVAANEDMSFQNMDYTSCNRYYYPATWVTYIGSAFSEKAAYDTVCYSQGWVELMGMELVDTNVDDYIEGCEIN